MRIILIGPRGVGKTSVAKILAEKLNLNYVSLDNEGKKLELPFRQTSEGRILTVKNTFDKYQGLDSVFDFGIYHSFFYEEEFSNEVYELLQPELNVVLLMPSTDTAESEQILREMNAKQLHGKQLDMVNGSNSRFISDDKNKRMAKYTIYTKDLNFEQIANLIISEIDD